MLVVSYSLRSIRLHTAPEFPLGPVARMKLIFPIAPWGMPLSSGSSLSFNFLFRLLSIRRCCVACIS